MAALTRAAALPQAADDPPSFAITKTVTPPTFLAPGATLTYTLYITGTPGETFALYDPLEGATFAHFVGPSGGLSASAAAISGTAVLTPGASLTLRFVVTTTATRVTNRACVRAAQTPLLACVWSNAATAMAAQSLFLPLVLRHFPNSAPDAPSQPAPADGARDRALFLTLGWQGRDPDQDALTYTLYLGAGSLPPVSVCAGESLTCAVGPLLAGREYSWQVVAHDGRVQTPGPLWRFTTASMPPAGWLERLNFYRGNAGLTAVRANPQWNLGCEFHARYMVKNDLNTWYEDPLNLWYTAEGAEAGRNSNVMVSSNPLLGDEAAVDAWMQGPFHALGLLDPLVAAVGFGSYREADGGWQMGAALDGLRGRASVTETLPFSVTWPVDGGVAPWSAYRGNETPDPLSSCPGYTLPSGPPLILQLGNGLRIPEITVMASEILSGTTVIEHCRFDEGSYLNSDSLHQQVGRDLLNVHDAVVLIPRAPLTPGGTYRVSVTAVGEGGRALTYRWAFVVATPPLAMTTEAVRVKERRVP